MDHLRWMPSDFWRSWTTREAIMARTVRPWAPTRRRMNTCCWALLLFLSENKPEVRMMAVMATPEKSNEFITGSRIFLHSFRVRKIELTSKITAKSSHRHTCRNHGRVFPECLEQNCVHLGDHDDIFAGARYVYSGGILHVLSGGNFRIGSD